MFSPVYTTLNWHEADKTGTAVFLFPFKKDLVVQHCFTHLYVAHTASSIEKFLITNLIMFRWLLRAVGFSYLGLRT